MADIKVTDEVGECVPYYPGMTLMPGQSTSVGMAIPISGGAAECGAFRLVQMPPPKTAPVQKAAVDLRGLGAESTLTLVNGARQAGSLEGRVVDVSAIPLFAIDRVDIVTGGCRQNAYNGNSSAWCVKCAPKAPRKKPSVVAPDLSGNIWRHEVA